VAGSSTSASIVASANKSVIDLTEDEDASAPAKRLITQTPQSQVFVAARQPMASASGLTVSALTLTSSTAVVKPMRPTVPPLLHTAPSQPSFLQVEA